MPNITTNHAITPTYMVFVRNYHADFTVQCLNGTFVLSAAERSLQLRLEERLLTAAREGDNSELKKLVGLIYISYFPPVSFNDNIFV